MSAAVVDTSAIIGHLTDGPWDTDQAVRAAIGSNTSLLLSDVVVADVVRVLESAFRTDRHLIATALRSLVAHESVLCLDPGLLLQAADLYEIHGLRFVDAYVVAVADTSGVRDICTADPAFRRLRRSDRATAGRS